MIFSPLFCGVYMVLLFACAAFSESATPELFPDGVGLRALGMGSAFTAIADDASAVYYNPAGLQHIGFQLGQESLDWERTAHDESTLTMLAWKGVGYINFLQSQKQASSIRGQYYGWSGGGSHGLSWGLTYKELNAQGKGIDIGLLCHITDEMSIGVLGQNIAFQNLAYPFVLRTGMAFSPMKDTLKFSADVVHSAEAVPRLFSGMEWTLFNQLSVRGGLAEGQATYGISLPLIGGRVDYATRHDLQGNRLHQLGFQVSESPRKHPRTWFPEKKWVEMVLQGNVVSGQDEFSLMGGYAVGADRLIRLLDTIHQDPGIEGVLIRLYDFPSHIFSTGVVQALRSALHQLQKNGKKVVIYVEDSAYGNTYYLASIADKIILPQGGTVGGIGERLQILRIHQLYKKLGIEWTLLTQGKYKAFLNGFKEKMTADEENMARVLVKDIYEQLIADVSSSRSLTPNVVRHIANGQLLTAEEAKQKGLIDDVGYYEDAKSVIKKMSGISQENSVRYISLASLADDPPQESLFMPWNRIAVIAVEGAIQIGHTGRNFLWGGKETGADTLIEQIERAKDDPSIRAIILRLNTPGGSAVASDRIYQAILSARKKDKIVIASMGDMAASGGYYIAAACNRIIAQSGTFTGSIGVIGLLPDYTELMKNLGISSEEFKEGDYMDAFSSLKKLSPDARNMLENNMKRIYDQFIHAVAEGRNLPELSVRKLAEGRVYTGTQALSNGLVDQLGDMHTAVQEAQRLANITGEPLLIFFDEEKPFWVKQFGSSAMNLLGIDKGMLPSSLKIKTESAPLMIY